MFSTFKEFLSIALSLGGLILFAACGKASNDKSPQTTMSTDPQTTEVDEVTVEQQPDEGFYKAILTPLNTELAGQTSGTIEVRIQGDDFFVESRVNGSPIAVKHLQNILSGTKCPDNTSDINNDGIIDITESIPAAGKIIIPLDSDLSEQLDGIEYGPISNNAGNFVYRRSTTLSRVLAGLRSIDPDPRDHIIKLNPEEELNLSGRVVMVHGIKHTNPLATGIGSYGPFTAEQSLPIACGVLIRQ